MRAAEHCPVSILQAHGGDAIPRFVMDDLERFVAITITPAVELPCTRTRLRAHQLRMYVGLYRLRYTHYPPIDPKLAV